MVDYPHKFRLTAPKYNPYRRTKLPLPDVYDIHNFYCKQNLPLRPPTRCIFNYDFSVGPLVDHPKPWYFTPGNRKLTQHNITKLGHTGPDLTNYIHNGITIPLPDNPYNPAKLPSIPSLLEIYEHLSYKSN